MTTAQCLGGDQLYTCGSNFVTGQLIPIVSETPFNLVVNLGVLCLYNKYHSWKAKLHQRLCYCRRPGGEKIYSVFDNQLPAALKKLPFDKHLSTQNVRKIVSEADGYQPHLIAPEQGYRRLIESSLVLFRGPAEAVVDAVCLHPLLLYYLFCHYLIPLKYIYIILNIHIVFFRHISSSGTLCGNQLVSARYVSLFHLFKFQSISLK